MTKKWRHWAFCVVLAVGSVLAAWSLEKFSYVQTIHLKSYDAHFVVRDYLFGHPAISNIVLLTADQKTMDTWPEPQLFWNKHYADASSRPRQKLAPRSSAWIWLLAYRSTSGKTEADDGLLAGAVSSTAVPVVVGFVERLQSNKAAQQIPDQYAGRGPGTGSFCQSDSSTRTVLSAGRN